MRKRTLLVILLTAFTAACIHKTSGPVTAWERVNVNMAALAQINQDVAKGIIAAQQTGLVTTQQAAPILNYQEVVAKDHAAIENILATGSSQATNRSAEIQALTRGNQKSGSHTDSIRRTGSEKSQEPTDLHSGFTGNYQSDRNRSSPTSNWRKETDHGATRRTRNRKLNQAILAAITTLGPLGVDLYLKLEQLFQLGPDEQANVAAAIKCRFSC